MTNQLVVVLKEKIILPHEYFSLSANISYFKECNTFCVTFVLNDSTISKVGVLCEIKSRSGGLISTREGGIRSYTSLKVKGLQRIVIKDIQNKSHYYSGIESSELHLSESDKEKLNKESIIPEVKELLDKYISYFEDKSLMEKVKIFEVSLESNIFLFSSMFRNQSNQEKLDLLLAESLYSRLLVFKEILKKQLHSIETRNNKIDEELTKDYRRTINSNTNKIQQLKDFNNQDSIENLIENVKNSKMHEEAKEIALNELSNFKNKSPMQFASEQQQWTINYIKTLLSMPWELYNQEQNSISRAEEILNRDHF